ncbi:FMN-dependent NADH-azoreductase [Nocardia sp. NPDC004750]
MKTLLHIEVSTRKDSISHALSARFADRWYTANPNGTIIHRDLAADPLPHINERQADHFMYRPGSYAHNKPQEIILTEQLIDEVRAADLLLLATPMHNFGVPSAMKAWIDHIVWPGYTFDQTSGQGLLDLSAIVVIARGGGYGPGTPRADWNFQEPYLQKVLEFIGVRNIEFVVAELTMFTGPDSPNPSLHALGEQSLRDAENQIDALTQIP